MQVSPLSFAPVEMTEGERIFRSAGLADDAAQEASDSEPGEEGEEDEEHGDEQLLAPGASGFSDEIGVCRDLSGRGPKERDIC